jgi:hypothetical protein
MMNKACLVAVVVMTLAAAAAGGAQVIRAMPLSATAETVHYRLTLQIGPGEEMYSKADAAKMHPASGEIMVSGTMADMSGMQMQQGMAMDTRHLEVHVTDRATGRVVTNATCRITVMDDATGKARVVPAGAMYGVKEGPSDWHYGNNVTMPPGRYTITVVVNGEQAIFRVTIPRM